ncbi:hypothetical protein [Streptosporangium sp. NBC_01756]|uniref:hypothetical protein n=1 Tax=Streptosporangium sp. NBC_01756 TaxID=2975950 RepID=UPI002DD8722B|nr:hypothetical protein [Streptosporangium sp. NBC_01756]WSC86593.1 hypothetical protein OIE48_40680 [Streptosporangium sp. NBC_01756]
MSIYCETPLRVVLAVGDPTVEPAAGVTRIFHEKISTRAMRRPELDRAVALAREVRASGVAVTIVVHEHKWLDRGLERAALAEQLKAFGVGLEFLIGGPAVQLKSKVELYVAIRRDTGNIIETGTESYRPAQTQAHANESATVKKAAG